MQKLGIVREDVSPTEETEDKVAFECDNEEEGQSKLIDRALESAKKAE